MIWTEEATDILTKLWAIRPQWSAGNIAIMFEEKYKIKITRNMILGKLHRLKLLNERCPLKSHNISRRRSPSKDKPVMDKKWR